MKSFAVVWSAPVRPIHTGRIPTRLGDVSTSSRRSRTWSARRTRVRMAVAAALASLVVAGCSGSIEVEDAAPVDPTDIVFVTTGTPSPTAKPTPSESPTPDGFPPENMSLKPPQLEDYSDLTKETDEGAKQAIAFFFDAMYYGYATGDTEPMVQISDLSICSNCENVVSEVNEWVNVKGNYLVPAPLEDQDLYVAGVVGDESEVHYRFTRPTFTQHYREGEPKVFEPRRVNGGGLVKFSDGEGWKVTDVAWEFED